MKTVSTTKERNGDDVKYTPFVGECSQNTSSETLPAQGLNESDNLIICDSNLASSFQEVKLSRSRLNPGHYLQKVFLHKLKSQSVPSLDKGKVNNNVQDVEDLEVTPKETIDSDLPACVFSENISVESTNKEVNGWYKTWPDCGVDKPKNGVVGEKVGASSNGQCDGKDALSGATENKCDCDRANLMKRNKAIPIDNLLDNLPIAYSPITKQIHLISNPDFCDTASRTNPLDNCDVKCSEIDSAVHRVNTEVSSFSSTVSSLSDVSPSTNGDSAVGSLFDAGDNSSLLSLGNCSIVSDDSGTYRDKRKGLTGFFSRLV